MCPSSSLFSIALRSVPCADAEIGVILLVMDHHIVSFSFSHNLEIAWNSVLLLPTKDINTYFSVSSKFSNQV